MQASFIIPLHGGLAFTRACLASLRATLPPGLACEVVLVDDASPDATRDWLAGPEVVATGCRVLLNETNLGFAATCNRGAAAATGDVLFFLNSDLVLLPGWYAPMAALAARHDSGLVGNVQLDFRTGAVDHAGIRFDAKGKPAHVRVLSPLARLRGWSEEPAVTGACLAVRRDAWNRLGGFDEGFRNGGEDVDLALRARVAGRRNRVSLRSVVRHHVSASIGRKRHDEENSRRLAMRWRSTLTRLAARDWSRRYLASTWLTTRDPVDYSLGAAALAAQFGWPAGGRLRRAVDAALEVEFSRWKVLLDGAAALVPPTPPPAEPVL